MATAMDRANVGYDQARMEGKGAVGSTADAVKAAAGRPTDTAVNHHNGLGHGTTEYDHSHYGTGLEHTEEELARLRNRTVVTGESEAYAPNPNIKDLPKEFETRVQVIQKYPEMKTVEKTDMVKEVRNEERTVTVPKTRVVMDEVERVDRVPVVREVPKTRIEQVHRVVTEEREVTDMVPVVEYVDTPRVEQVPRVVTEEVTERVTVPVVVEVPVTRTVEVPTGKYCEAPVEQIVNPGHPSGVTGALHRTTSSSSSSSDEEVAYDALPTQTINPDGTTSVAPAGRKHKRGLMAKLLHH